MNNLLVIETLNRLREHGLRVVPAGDSISLVPDVNIWLGGALYLVRPLTRRSWTVRQALRDAETIVRSVQFSAKPSRDAVPA